MIHDHFTLNCYIESRGMPHRQLLIKVSRVANSINTKDQLNVFKRYCKLAKGIVKLRSEKSFINQCYEYAKGKVNESFSSL